MQQSCIIKCPHCGEKILKQKGDTQELRDKITLFEKGRTISFCKRCGKPVEVPVRVISDL